MSQHKTLQKENSKNATVTQGQCEYISIQESNVLVSDLIIHAQILYECQDYTNQLVQLSLYMSLLQASLT